MRIPVPEMDERFNCTEDAIEHFVRVCSVIVDKAKKVYTSASVSDVPGYALEICRKVLTHTTTLVRVAREKEDYNALCALVRILADNIAVINLVYNCSKEEERFLRHLLYVLDGVSERYELLKDRFLLYDGRIPRETHDVLVAQVNRARDNALGCIHYCERTIKTLTIYEKYPAKIDTLIQEKNWKYKSINSPRRKHSYTWKEMYNMLNIKEAGEMFSYFSQYIHGLSISNLAINDADDFDAPLSFTVCLMGWLFNYLRKEYEPIMGDYTWEDVYKMAPELFGE